MHRASTTPARTRSAPAERLSLARRTARSGRPRAAFGRTYALSVSVALALTAVTGAVWADPPDGRGEAPANDGDAAARAPTPVVIIDARAGDAAERGASRAALARALDAEAALVVVPADSALAAILAGASPGVDGARLEALAVTLERAERALGGGDCAQARALVETTIAPLAALQAASQGEPATVQALARAYTTELRCAHEAGDVDAASRAVARMRRLGFDADTLPAGVPASVWAAHPEVDATANAHWVEIAVDTDPSGAEVWLDHHRLGAAPVTALVPEGPHLLAAAGAGADGARAVTVDRAQLPAAPWGQAPVLPLALTLTEAPHPWAPEAALIARWQNRLAEIDGAGVRTIMDKIGVRFALVLTPSQPDAARGDAELWTYGVGGESARRVATGSTERPASLAARVAARAAQGADVGTEQPLLREDDVAPRWVVQRSVAPARKPWWVYATIIGAVTASVTLILAADLGDRRQRIELRLP